MKEVTSFKLARLDAASPVHFFFHICLSAPRFFCFLCAPVAYVVGKAGMIQGAANNEATKDNY